MRIRGKANQTRRKRIRIPREDTSSSHPNSRSRPKTSAVRNSQRTERNRRDDCGMAGMVTTAKTTLPTASTTVEPEDVTKNLTEGENGQDSAENVSNETTLDDGLGGMGGNDDGLGGTGGNDDGQNGIDGQKGVGDDQPQKETKHIHPCICDLSKRQRERIKAHLEHREKFETRHIERLKEIDLERLAIEEEIRRKQQEEAEHEELFGDQYEVVGKKKKRMKRSARRASMVSLGVKQVINWRRSPKIKVKYNKVSELRKTHHSYCGKRKSEGSPSRKINYDTSPKIPIRITRAYSLRNETNVKKVKDLISKEDKRRMFVFSHYIYATQT